MQSLILIGLAVAFRPLPLPATIVPTLARPTHRGGWVVGAPYTVGSVRA
ncbi:MAG TPA: hypothetical protein VMT69_00490 [Kineosporiaceae bacterium]|nr:hypothetical protein [Kineosporiaceae bacterium]